MHFSDNAIHAILAARFRSGGGSDWVGLSTTVPDDDSTGATEPVGGGYARVELPRTTDSWQAPAGRQIVTADDVTWGEATDDWGVLLAWVLFDAETAGDPVVSGRLNDIDVFDGDRPTLVAGSITITAP